MQSPAWRSSRPCWPSSARRSRPSASQDRPRRPPRGRPRPRRCSPVARYSVRPADTAGPWANAWSTSTRARHRACASTAASAYKWGAAPTRSAIPGRSARPWATLPRAVSPAREPARPSGGRRDADDAAAEAIRRIDRLLHFPQAFEVRPEVGAQAVGEIGIAVVDVRAPREVRMNARVEGPHHREPGVGLARRSPLRVPLDARERVAVRERSRVVPHTGDGAAVAVEHHGDRTRFDVLEGVDHGVDGRLAERRREDVALPLEPDRLGCLLADGHRRLEPRFAHGLCDWRHGADERTEHRLDGLSARLLMGPQRDVHALTAGRDHAAARNRVELEEDAGPVRQARNELLPGAEDMRRIAGRPGQPPGDHARDGMQRYLELGDDAEPAAARAA